MATLRFWLLSLTVCVILLNLSLLSAAANPSSDIFVREAEHARFLVAKEKAIDWLSTLDIDPVELVNNGLKGIKRFAEILEIYVLVAEYEQNSDIQASLRARIATLEHHTHSYDYHDFIAEATGDNFKENSLPYMRIMLLLKRAGHDISEYLERFDEIKYKFDSHFSTRSPGHRQLFARYYTKLGLEKPLLLQEVDLHAQPKRALIERRREAHKYLTTERYELTQEIFLAFDHGLSKRQTRFSESDIQYFLGVVPRLTHLAIQNDEIDLSAEFLCCLTYIRAQRQEIYNTAVDYILRSQNENGSWGLYESARSKYGKYVDHQLYLHTTAMALRGLMEAFDPSWETTPIFPPSVLVKKPTKGKKKSKK